MSRKFQHLTLFPVHTARYGGTIRSFMKFQVLKQHWILTVKMSHLRVI